MRSAVAAFEAAVADRDTFRLEFGSSGSPVNPCLLISMPSGRAGEADLELVAARMRASQRIIVLVAGDGQAPAPIVSGADVIFAPRGSSLTGAV